MLEVDGLTLAFPGPDGWIQVVRDVSFSIGEAEFVGLVGESGSGKSLTALSIVQLLPPAARILGGRILFEGQDLLRISEDQMRPIRGRRIGFIFQEPMTALNPVLTIGAQLREAVRTHRPLSRTEAQRKAVRLLDLVTISGGKDRLNDYPHELSGGQRQRVMIALALASEPSLLIADEPTTALDVTIQAQVLELFESLRRDLGLSVLLITHDLGVVAETCDRTVVLYAGQVVEQGTASDVLLRPAHPYTEQLLAALPRAAGEERRSEDAPSEEETRSTARFQPIPGAVPEPARLPSGCAFHPRCMRRIDGCERELPELSAMPGDRLVRCVLYAGDR